MLVFASTLSGPLAPMVGAYLLSNGGYVCVFSTSLALTMLGALYMMLRIRSFNWKPEKKEVYELLFFIYNGDYFQNKCTI